MKTTSKSKYNYIKLSGSARDRRVKMGKIEREFVNAQRGSIKSKRFVADKPNAKLLGTTVRVLVNA